MAVDTIFKDTKFTPFVLIARIPHSLDKSNPELS